MKKNIKIFLFLILLISISLIIFRGNKSIIKEKKKVEIVKKVLPISPFINKKISKRELLKCGSSFIYYIGEARPGIVGRYDIALLDKKMWYENGTNLLNELGTVSLVECSFTEADGGTKLYNSIPDSLKKRAVGPKPTLIMDIEDLWLSLLKEYRIKDIIKRGFDGIVIDDLNLIGVSHEAVTDLRLFLGELKIDFPNLLILFKGNLESAMKLNPFLDGFIMVGFNHAINRNPKLAEELKLSGIPVIFTIDMIDLQLSKKSIEAYNKSLNNGFIPFIGNNPALLVSNPKLPPDSGNGFLKLINFKDEKISLDGKNIELNSKGKITVLKEVKNGFHKFVVNDRTEEIHVISGKTSVYYK